MQAEALSLGTPVLVMRDITEIMRDAETGVTRNVGMDPDTIVSTTYELLENRAEYDRRPVR